MSDYVLEVLDPVRRWVNFPNLGSDDEARKAANIWMRAEYSYLLDDTPNAKKAFHELMAECREDFGASAIRFRLYIIEDGNRRLIDRCSIPWGYKRAPWE